jgi:hypothetical protein
VIRVGRGDGPFTAIRLRAAGNDVRMLDLKVVYGNGAPDVLPVRAVIRAGGTSGAIDLKGQRRQIRQIDMVYAARPNFRGHARVCVEGRIVLAGGPVPPPRVVVPVVPVAPVGPPRAWVELGCRDVNFRVDRDVIQVGRRDGYFTAIRLRAIGNDVRMLDLKVVYGNGEPDNLPVRAVIAAGRTSGALDLHGTQRLIRRIEMVYVARPEFRGRARICVEGRI